MICARHITPHSNKRKKTRALFLLIFPCVVLLALKYLFLLQLVVVCVLVCLLLEVSSDATGDPHFIKVYGYIYV